MNKLIIMILLLAGLPMPAHSAAVLDGWQIVQLSAPDQVAVAKMPAGELRLVRAGDRLDERTVVTGFDGERLVLEQPGAWGRATLFVSVVDGRQQIERLERQPYRKSDRAGDEAAIRSRTP